MPPPAKSMELRVYEISSESTLTKNVASYPSLGKRLTKMILLAGQTTEINMHISTFPVYYSLQHWFQLPNHSLIFQVTPFADENSKINCSFGRTECCWEEDSEEIILHCLASFNMSHPNTRCVHVDLACMGVGREIALIGDTIGKPNNCTIIGDTRQAMSEEKNHSVETYQTGGYSPALPRCWISFGILQ